MAPLVSIIVPCFKQAHYLDQSLLSLLTQTYENWECIIINDGSPDHTAQAAAKWLEKDDRFKYMEQENRGLSAARNAGIQLSKGAYILPLDADDLLHPDHLQLIVPILEDQQIAVASSYTDFFINNKSNKVGGLRPKSGKVRDLLHVNQLIATSLYRKSDWERIGGYDETMKKGFEDWEFWLRLLKNGNLYHVVPQSLFYYRKSKKSMLVTTIANHSIKVKKYIVHKHRDLYIEDFDNYVTVCAHDLQVAVDKLHRIENTITYKIAIVLLKPLRIVQKMFLL